MQNRKLLFLGLLLPLMMSNSPAPMPTMDTYKDIDVKAELIKEEDESYEYRLYVTNTETRYASVQDITTEDTACYVDKSDRIFRNEYIAPGKAKEIIVKTNKKLNLEIEMDWETTCLMEDDPNITYENPSIEKWESESSNPNTYAFKSKLLGRGDYNYWTVLDVIYKDEEISFVVETLSDSTHLFSTNEPLELDKLSIQKMTAYKGRKFSYFSCSCS